MLSLRKHINATAVRKMDLLGYQYLHFRCHFSLLHLCNQIIRMDPQCILKNRKDANHAGAKIVRWCTTFSLSWWSHLAMLQKLYIEHTKMDQKLLKEKDHSQLTLITVQLSKTVREATTRFSNKTSLRIVVNDFKL